MIKIRKYVKAESLEEAYQLNQKRSNRIIGGMLWVKMGRNTVQNAIDISGIVPSAITEQEDKFIIGAMTTLRTLEQHGGLNEYTQGAMRESVRHIVGVQFRNMATVGGSIYGRYGFSDVLTMFLALDSYVELYKGGIVPLWEYAEKKKDGDIIVNIIVKKRKPCRVVYLSQRNTKTDFPVLTCAVSFGEHNRKAVIGARPQRAVIMEANEEVMQIPESDAKAIAEAFARQIENEVVTGSNMRGSAKYRRHLAGVLVRRACLEILGREEVSSC